MILLLLLALAAPQASAAPGLQVPSPDWRDQVIYFVVTDRFDDGDRSNDDQRHGEYNPKDGNLYSGGDLRGLSRRLDYIKDLGGTAVWITPPVANVWWDPALKMAGYHGYWAENFDKVDAHLGTLEDYKALSEELHGRGMYLLQDIVVNHTGDFVIYDSTAGFRLKSGMVPPRPTQRPFTDYESGAYHRTPDITDFNDDKQRLTYQMGGLDDIATENPMVRDVLRATYGRWIREAGVDGFRFDSVPYVERDFYGDFLQSASTEAPGMEAVAKSMGKNDFFTFGEVWSNGSPFSDVEEKTLEGYLDQPGKPGLKAVLNFPLVMDLRAVFAKGAPADQLRYRLDGLNRHFHGGRSAINLVDNQDMARFLAEGSEAGLAQALAVVFTIPGTPLVYYGTEQGFKETRGAMFAGGFASGGRDHFDPSQPLYKLIQELARLRAREPVLRHGTLVPLYGEGAGPGAVAYRVDLGEDRVLALFNSADEESLLARLPTGAPAGALLKPLLSRGMPGSEIRIGTAGRLSMRLPPRSILIAKIVPGPKSAPQEPSAPMTTFSDGAVLSGPTTVSGSTHAGGRPALVIDGRIARAVRADVKPTGSWSASFDAATLTDGAHSFTVVDDATGALAVSEPHPFSVKAPWVFVKAVDDPVGDDKGPDGKYLYPLSSGYQGRADIKKLSLYRRGRDAKLVITMANGLSRAWNPPFGFDHVCFNIYITPPGSTHWQYAMFAGGWKAALTMPDGTLLQPAPNVSSDEKAGTVEIVFSGDYFPRTSQAGASYYVTTWDYDGVEGGLRGLSPQPGDYSFGGGAPGDPRIMDDAVLKGD